MKKINGFTLAEVLITLTIIGVIAALTIPNLMSKYQEHVLVTKLKKFHTTFSQAFAQAVRENGPAEDWTIDSTNYTPKGSTNLYNYLKPYLKISKDCGQKSGCFASYYSRLFGSGELGGNWSILDTKTNNWHRFQLEDGTSVAILNEVSETGVGAMFVDVNGKQGPNKLGVDLFLFGLILPQQVTPEGIDTLNGTNKCVFKDTSDRNGAACGAWVIYKGNMDYLHRDISKEWK